MLPADENILLSYVNMKLRDEYSSLDDLCYDEDILKSDLEEKLFNIGYVYSADKNAFISK